MKYWYEFMGHPVYILHAGSYHADMHPRYTHVYIFIAFGESLAGRATKARAMRHANCYLETSTNEFLVLVHVKKKSNTSYFSTLE